MERKNCFQIEEEHQQTFGVIKFGGSSLADSKSVDVCVNTVLADNFLAVVVSAPGETTNLIRAILDQSHRLDNYESLFSIYSEIINGLGLADSGLVEKCFREFDERMQKNEPEEVLAWGEWSMAQIFAARLGGEFFDTKDLLKIRHVGDERRIDCTSAGLVQQKVTQSKGICVFPGYYGTSVVDGKIMTLNRGGSDYTGIFVAHSLGMGLVKSTDVGGLWDNQGNVLSNASYCDLERFDEEAKLINKQARDFAISTNTPIWIKCSKNSDFVGTIIC